MAKRKKLTDKQEKFVQGLVRGMTQKDAYIKAYNTKNMKEDVIRAKAWEVLQVSYVAERYEKLRNKVIEKSERETIASALEVMEYLTQVMRGEVTEENIVTENIGDYMSEARTIMTQVKPKDRNKAAELLGKKYSLFTEKITVEGDVNVSTKIASLSDEELDEELKKYDD